MTLGVAEIRERAERLKRAVARERYETNAGLKDRPEFTAVYTEHDFLIGPEILPAIQRELSEAEREERQRLRYLEAWVAEQRVEAAVAPLEDEYRAWEATTSVRVDGEDVPFRQLVRRIQNEGSRPARLELERRRAEKLEEAIPLLVDILHREREALTELGLGGLVEARERLTGLNIRGLEREAVRILGATEDRYQEQLRWVLRRRLEADGDRADRSDFRRLRRMPWLDDHFRLDVVLERVRRDLSELGLPLEAEGRVLLDLGSRPRKGTRSFCAPLEVPERVILVVAPAGGRPDCESLLHEVGHALHFAYTSAQLPFEYRALGDTAVTETYAILFEHLSLDTEWLRRATELGGHSLAAHGVEAGLLGLYRLRRLAAKLLFEVELYDARLPGEMGGRYAELLGGATGARYDERTFLDDLDRGFWVARQLRAWMLSALLRRELRERYDLDWYRNPSAGAYLEELLRSGQKDDAARLAARFGAERLCADALLAELESGGP